jgi:hypothetical protein
MALQVPQGPVIDDAGVITPAPLAVPDFYATVRTNPITGRLDVLGVVGSKYQPVQNEASCDLLDALVDQSGGAHFETAGALRGGRETFVTMKLPSSIVLETHPAPRLDPEPGTPLPIYYNRAYSNAKAALSRERLVDLYECERMSLKGIAATVAVSRQIIARLARDYDLPLREPGLQARTTIERDWLYDQYVNKRRGLPDIAKEAGMSTANMARWAKAHAIPMRGRGGRSHSSTLAAERAAVGAPDLIKPALVGIGGWERL